MNNSTKEFIELRREGSYYNYSWDSDSENDEERQYLLELEEIKKIEQRNDKVLYDNGKWLITSNNKINDYCDLIKKNNILFEQIKSIEKKTFIMDR